MIELKDVYIHCDGDSLISNLSVWVDDGCSLLVYGGSAIQRQCLTEALLGIRPVAEGYLTYDGEVFTTAAARYLRSSIGYVPARAPEPQVSLRQMADRFVQLGAFRRFRKELNGLTQLWQTAGITATIADAACATLSAEELQTGMLCIAQWLNKKVVIVDDIASPKTAQILREMATTGTLVIATAEDNILAEYFDNNINLDK